MQAAASIALFELTVCMYYMQTAAKRPTQWHVLH